MPAARPTERLIERALAAWRAAGLEVGGLEVSPDGTVRILAPGAQGAQADTGNGGGASCDGKFGRRAR